MDISIIIPSFNTELSITKTLLKLEQQTTHLDYEILVIDCSEHNKVEALCADQPHTRCIKVAERFNPGIGRNIGADAAKGKLLIFVDADVHLEPSTLSKAWSHFEAGQKIFGGALELNTQEDDSFAAYLEHYFFNHESQANRPSCQRSNLSSAFMCFDKDTFINAGGFKDIPRMQDTELTERLRASGQKLYFFSDLIAQQTQDSPMPKVLNKIYINGQNVYYIRYQKSMTGTKKVLLAALLPVIGLAKTLRIIARHLRYQPNAQKLTTLKVSPLLIYGGAMWTKGFYNALITNKGISTER